MKKRFVSLLLTGCMLMGMIPIPVQAAGVSAFESTESGGFQAVDPEEPPEEADIQEEKDVENGFSSEIPSENKDQQLYQNQSPNYDDPEFVNRLSDGFFSDEGASSRAANGSIHDDRFDGYTIEDGIDVSQWNGDVDWETVAGEVDFALIRGGYRGTGASGSLNKDPYFEDNIREAVAAGLDVGVYIFSQAITTAEAREEAAYILDLVDGYSFDLPIVIDYEFSAGGRLSNAGLTNAQHTSICLAFCDAIEDAGYPAMVYANQNMLTNSMDGQKIIDKGYEIWMAQYRSSSTYTGDYSYWQYTETGSVAGIHGNVDLNYHYVKPSTARLQTPSLVSAALTDDGAKITWRSVSGADGYLVYRKSGSSGWKMLEPTTANQYTDVGDLQGGTTYTYTVRAFRGSYEEAKEHKFEAAYWSGYTSSGISLRYLSTPVLKNAIAAADGVRVTWETVPGAQSYDVYRRVPGASWTKIGSTALNDYTDNSSLNSGTTYIYTVRARSGSHRSLYVGTGTRLCYLAIPSLSGISKASGNVNVQWQTVFGAEGYDVYRRAAGESWKKISRTGSTSYTDKSVLTKGITYTYTVRAYKGNDRGYYKNTGIKIKY